MAGFKAIKAKIRSVDKSRQVTKAMETVSAVKMRKAQQRAVASRPYARAAASILARVSAAENLAQHPLTQVRPVRLALYMVVTSDKGLAGALNSSVLRATLADITQSGLTPNDVSIIAIGKKAREFFSVRGFTVEIEHNNTDEITPEMINSLVSEISNRYIHKAFDTVKVSYQHFWSTFEQRPTIRTIFPLTLSELEKVVVDILPKNHPAQQESAVAPHAYTIEPNEHIVLDEILERMAAIFIFHALIESQASEHSARMVAMKSASDKATEMKRMFVLAFNKARQAAITQEVSEITGGMEAIRSV